MGKLLNVIPEEYWKDVHGDDLLINRSKFCLELCYHESLVLTSGRSSKGVTRIHVCGV